MLNIRLINLSLIISGILMVILMLIPELDIIISNFFYNTEKGFLHKKSIIILLLFKIIPIITKIFVSICIIYIIYTLIKYRNIKYTISSWAFFLIITTAIGPGLTINLLLKQIVKSALRVSIRIITLKRLGVKIVLLVSIKIKLLK